MSDEDRASAPGWSSAEEFRSFLIERLGHGWDVGTVAQVQDAGGRGRVMSVAAVASQPNAIKVHVTHDRGVDVVLVSLGDGPRVPFEDLAVAKGEIALPDLVHLGVQALAKPPGRTAFTLETTLRLICEWGAELARDLDPSNRSMVRKLKEASEEFESAVRGDSRIRK